MARFGEINAQYFDDAGDPLGGGKIYFYESGTTTPKTTYADVNFTIPNTNPVVLTAAGRQPNIFFNGNAKAILTDSNDVQILSRDPVGETASNFGDPWVATRIYSTNSVVIGSDGVYYRSLVPANQNNNPVTTSGYWSLLYSVQWNAGITYQEGAVVTYNGEQYQSLQSSNLNQNPSTAATYWTLLSFAWISTAVYADNQNAVGSDGILYTSQQAANTGNDPTDPANRPTYWVGTSADAAASAAAAAVSEAAAAASEAAAATSEANAATSATNSANSAASSASSATDSANSATASASSATASAASASAAATSESNAATSESNSATSASNSATSATASAASASAASASESAAAASQAAAATSESNAAASASSSATSAANSATSAAASASSATDSANSATASAGSATAAAGSATSAAGSATAAAGSATSAATSATDAAASLDEFTDIYLGAKSTAPTVDNDGNPLQAGALYFNTVSNTMFVYSGSSWAAAGSAVNGTAERQEYVATSGQTNFSATYDVGFVDVYLNGIKLVPTTDFTATDGATVILTTGAVAGDNVSIIAYGAFNVADVYTQAQSDARYTQKANNLSDLDNAATALTNLGLTATAAELNYTDGVTSSIQTQLDAKPDNLADLGVTATSTELNYVDGVTSNIQTQIDNIDALPSQTGNNGLFLTTDGSTASWAEAGGGAWELLATYTPSGASTINIEDFSSTYDDYVIIGTLACNTTALPRIRIKIGAGSYGTSSYAYSTLNYNAFQYDSSQVGILMGDSVADGSNAASIKMSFITNCSNVNDSTYHGVYGQTNNATGYNVRGAAYSGYYHGASGTLSGVQYLPSAGTYTGTIRIYGIKKA